MVTHLSGTAASLAKPCIGLISCVSLRYGKASLHVWIQASKKALVCTHDMQLLTDRFGAWVTMEDSNFFIQLSLCHRPGRWGFGVVAFKKPRNRGGRFLTRALSVAIHFMDEGSAGQAEGEVL